MPVSPGSLSGWSRGSPNPGLWRVPGREEISWVPSWQASVSQTESAWEGRTCRPRLRTAPGWCSRVRRLPPPPRVGELVASCSHPTRSDASLESRAPEEKVPSVGMPSLGCPSYGPISPGVCYKAFSRPQACGARPATCFLLPSIFCLFSVLAPAAAHTWLPPSPATAVPGSQQWPLPAGLGCAHCAWLSLSPWPPGCGPPRLPSRAVAA